MLVLDPKPNVDLLTKVLDHIERDPKTWRQDSYRSFVDEESACATAFCFAGHTAVMTGAQVSPYGVGWWLAEDGTLDHHATTHVSDWARDRLGLTDDEANKLFAPFNDLGDLRTLVQRYINRAHAVETYEALVLGAYEPEPFLFAGHHAVVSTSD